MLILLLCGLALVGCAVTFAARTLVFGGIPRRETLEQISSYGFTAPVPAEAERARRDLRDLLDGLARSAGRVAMPVLGVAREQETRRLLRSAGYYRVDAETFVGYRLLAGVFLPVGLLFLSSLSGGLTARALILVCFVGVWGWVLPSFFVKRRAAGRLQEIDLEMPELVDLLVTSVEAGIGFTAALQSVAARVEGPLAQELRISLQEHAMGLSMENALQNMLDRVESISVRVFVQAIIQGQVLGVSIGRILRDLAVDMRKRRRQLAEERAQKAPTKILFPLVFLILPALFIIVLGGPMIGLGTTLGGLAS